MNQETRIYNQLGSHLAMFRRAKSESITDAAKAIAIDRTHLSKLENGHERPSVEVLNRLISHFSLSRADALMLSNFAGFAGKGLVVEEHGGKEGEDMKPNDASLVQPTVNINLPGDKPILYTDSVFITSNPYGIVFNIAQSMDDKNQQIVARIGMSRDHAKVLADLLAKHLAMTTSNKPKQ